MKNYYLLNKDHIYFNVIVCVYSTLYGCHTVTTINQQLIFTCKCWILRKNSSKISVAKIVAKYMAKCKKFVLFFSKFCTSYAFIKTVGIFFSHGCQIHFVYFLRSEFKICESLQNVGRIKRLDFWIFWF